jgi:hypothetical protein
LNDVFSLIAPEEAVVMKAGSAVGVDCYMRLVASIKMSDFIELNTGFGIGVSYHKSFQGIPPPPVR